MRNLATGSLFLLLTSLPVAGQLNPSPQNPRADNDSPAKASDARAILAQAKESALGIKGGFQRGLLLDEIGAAQAKAGDLDAAVVTANQAYPHTMATLAAIGGAAWQLERCC